MSAEQQYIRVRWRLADYRKAQQRLLDAYVAFEAQRAAVFAAGVTGNVELPTERPWREAQHDLLNAHRGLVEAIMDAPLILSDVARLVGGE